MIELPNKEKGVVFTIKGAFAHFRKTYTQTSMLTYPFPPRTALSGIVGAVLGVPRDEVYELMQPPNAYFVLEILTPIRKLTVTTNFISTKEDFRKPILKAGKNMISCFESTKNRTQIPMEILMPCPPYNMLSFRVAFWHKDLLLLKKFTEMLSNKQSFFPVYLGISEFLASIEMEGITSEILEINNYEGEINSVVVNEAILNVNGEFIKTGNKFNIEYVLLYANKDFSDKYYSNIVYSDESKPLSLRVVKALKYQQSVWVLYEAFK